MSSFFNKVKENIEKGVNTVSTKSKEMLDTTKLKRELDALIKQKNEALLELGQITHTSVQLDQFDMEKAKEKSAAIVTIEADIKEKEAEIEQVHAKAQEDLEKK